MAKTTPDTPAVAEVEPVMGLKDFLLRLSETVRRPELLGAFEYHAKANGQFRATWSDFLAKYEAFSNQPV